MALIARLKRHWKELEAGEPGRRFQDRYEHARQGRSSRNLLRRGLKIGAAIVAILVGLVEIVFPGPAVVFLFVGAALLASESRIVAKALDRMEVAGRKLWRKARRRWRGTSSAGRGAAVSIAVALAGAGAFVAYRVIVG